MNVILQLNPTIPVYTKLGKGRAIMVIDYGQDINTCWVVALINGEIKHFDSNDIRMEENHTYGFSKPKLPDDWVK
jgi:hypothetical protein